MLLLLLLPPPPPLQGWLPALLPCSCNDSLLLTTCACSGGMLFDRIVKLQRLKEVRNGQLVVCLESLTLLGFQATLQACSSTAPASPTAGHCPLLFPAAGVRRGVVPPAGVRCRAAPERPFVRCIDLPTINVKGAAASLCQNATATAAAAAFPDVLPRDIDWRQAFLPIAGHVPPRPESGEHAAGLFTCPKGIVYLLSIAHCRACATAT